MPIFDMSLADLKTYHPPRTRRSDFETFWQETLHASALQPLEPSVEQVSYPVPEIEAFAIRYAGWQGARIAAWYLLPTNAASLLPTLVFYHGYSGAKANIYRYLPWVLQGYTVLAVDVRGQAGDSIDTTVYSSGHATGWLTQGILNEHEYYYRGVYVDAVRALDFLATREEIDMTRVGVTGFSQGGGLALVVTALDNRPALAMPGMPFLCHFERPLELSRAYPYWEIADYLRHYPARAERVFQTLAYFDNLNLADWIHCPVLFSVGLLDEICPPSTIFAVYNRLNVPKQIAVFPYHGHEIPEQHQETELRWANHYLRGVLEAPEEPPGF
ncbi:MAG: acetylxylan esterase [Ardenticatenaceae bacterium]